MGVTLSSPYLERTMKIEEFARDLLQDVLAEADADGQFREDVFFEKACECLMEAR